MLTVGIDVDGVLADYNTAMLKELNTLAKRDGRLTFDPGPQVFCQWDWPHKWFGKELYDEAQRTAHARSEWWGDLVGLQPARVCGAVVDLAEKHHVWFITHRPILAHRATQQWLSRELGMKDEHINVICTAAKGHVAHALQLDAMIDDKPENIRDVMQFRGLECAAILLRQPWNQQPAHHTDFWRRSADTLGQALGMVRELE